MNKAWFKKYKSSDDNDMLSYFDDNSNLAFEDSITINGLPEGAVSNITLETEARDNFFQIRPGNFNIQLSYLQDDISLNGKSIRDFFKDTKEKKLSCIAYVNGEYYSGFVDMSTIIPDFTFKSEHEMNYDITMSVRGALTEFKSYALTKPLPVIGGNPFYMDIYLNMGGPLAGSQHISFINQLNISERLFLPNGNHWTPKISLELYDWLRLQNNDVSKLNSWIAFYSMALELGFIFTIDVNPNSLDTQFPVFNFTILWRTGDASVKIPQKAGHKEGFLLSDQNKWILVRNWEWTWDSGSFEHHITYTLSEGIRFSQKENFKTEHHSDCTPKTYITPKRDGSTIINPGPFVADQTYWVDWPVGNLHIPKSEHKDELTINLDCRFPVSGLGFWAMITFARIFVWGYWHTIFEGRELYVDYGNSDILDAYTRAEYQYLLFNTKDTIEMKIIYPDQSIKLFSKIQYGGKNYFVNRIKNIDTVNLTAVIEGIEC